MIRVACGERDPVEVLRRLSRGERPFLLDGASDADGLGRFSFAGCDPIDGLVWRRGDAGRPLELLEAAARRWSAGPIDDKPWPLAVGYLAYDLGAELVARSAGRTLAARDELGLPELDFARYAAVWRFDRINQHAEILALDGEAASRLLRRFERAPPPLAAPRVGAVRWGIADADYRARVERVLDYLRAGDCYQVNLSHRLFAPLDDDGALPLYLRLRAAAPAPLGAYLRTGAGALVCNSPELFLRASPSSLETRPIKGTRPRGADAERDASLAAVLRASEKENAEHLMIVDLERNDLGRVAVTGSVHVDGYARLVTLPTLHHLVSTVRARPRPGVGLGDLLTATFPGGSITGAPKLRAMEIIDELEGVRRGPYCGALGWLGASGHLDLALAIRTAVVRSGELILSVGGGIVADSLPDEELLETRVKAEAFLRALA
ncbi:MAG TPA: anthranilate synthase component I family protein [Polyangia bacterium]|nr:anthranilate synthase component I family protein [Polyangia bacterium]